MTREYAEKIAEEFMGNNKYEEGLESGGNEFNFANKDCDIWMILSYEEGWGEYDDEPAWGTTADYYIGASEFLAGEHIAGNNRKDIIDLILRVAEKGEKECEKCEERPNYKSINDMKEHR